MNLPSINYAILACIQCRESNLLTLTGYFSGMRLLFLGILRGSSNRVRTRRLKPIERIFNATEILILATRRDPQMSEKRGRGQPKFKPTPDQRSQAKLMKALGIPEDRICQTIINPRTKKPVAPVTLARAFPRELESGATECHALVGNLILCAILGKRPARRSDQKRTGPHDRGDLLRENPDGLERDGGEGAGQQGRQTGSRRRRAAAADRRGRPHQGAESAAGGIGDRLLARTARRSAKSRCRRADPRDGAWRSQRVRIRLALSRPARTTAARRFLAGMAADGGAWLWQDPLRRRMGAGGDQGGASSDRPGRADCGRRAQRYGRGRIRHSGHFARSGAPTLRAQQAPADVAQRGDRHHLFGR